MRRIVSSSEPRSRLRAREPVRQRSKIDEAKRALDWLGNSCELPFGCFRAV